MSGALLAASLPKIPLVNLDGETGILGAAVTPSAAQAGVRINNDGTIDKRTSATYTQIDAATDWIIPNGATKSKYSVRCTDNLANLDAGSDATGSWLALTSTREWYVSQTGLGTKSLNITLEISDDGGSTVIASGTYTGTAEVTT